MGAFGNIPFISYNNFPLIKLCKCTSKTFMTYTNIFVIIT